MSNGESAQGVFEGYDGGEEPLPSYAALAGLFNLILAIFLLLARKTGRPIPERVEARERSLRKEIQAARGGQNDAETVIVSLH